MTTPRRRRRRRAGSALILVLTMVTIVSVLVLVYMGTVRVERSATQSYSQRISADQIALGGLDRLEQDFQQEIRAGSTANTNAAAHSPVYYKPVPLQTRSMVPARYNTANASLANLIRTSTGNANNYAAAYPSASYPDAAQVPADLAVASSTVSNALDGSFTSLKRWAKPQLLLPGEAMPAPDWILMTRSGPTNAAGIAFGPSGNTLNNRDSSNPNYVHGRYAYAVYDEGGLLDATVAGAPGVAADDDLGNRGSVALAPLTNGVLTPAQASALASWRNRASAASQGAYANYVYNLAATNGFLHVQPNDNTFLSRQDLIAYAAYAGIASALPYLGTFNRAVNAPAYSPPAATAQNPDLLTLRFAFGGTVDTGGTLLKSRAVQAGDFLFSRRFPLSRLAWIGYNGVAGGASATDVWRAFGLVWDGANNAWAYVGGGGASPPAATAVKTSIETLAQVALESAPREPDFFELLQAGILQGSLGQTGGAQVSFTSGSLYLYGGSGDTSGYDGVPAYQLVQIGANIIDQARADNFPTAIRFGPDPLDKSVDGQNGGIPKTVAAVRTFYGIKNLPYISRVIDTFARWTAPPAPLSNADKLPAGAFPGKVYTQPYVGVWQQVELWNPHQAPASALVTIPSPTALRVVVQGSLHGYVYSHKDPVATSVLQPTYAPGVTTAGAASETACTFAGNYLELKPAALSGFAEPKLVSPQDIAAASPAPGLQDGSSTTGGTAFAGMYVGSAYAPDWGYCGGNAGTQYPTDPLAVASATIDPVCVTYNLARVNPFTPASFANPGVTYAMQYKDPSNTWRTYGLVKNQTLAGNSSIPASSKNNSTWTLEASNANALFIQKVDPRTDRFSTSQYTADQTANDANPVGSSQTMRPDAITKGHSADSCLPYGASWLGSGKPPVPNNVSAPPYYLGGITENTAASPVYYQDPDGVLRRGDSAYDSAASQDGHPGVANSSFVSNVNLARPVFLNRPFRSVGELGYVDRDLPWKTLDFFTKESGDAGLLDLFSVSDADVVAGTIDVNTRNAQALAEVLGGAAVNPSHVGGDVLAAPLAPALAGTLAASLVAATTAAPLRSRAELVTAALDAGTGETALATAGYTAQTSKIQREAAIRALSESGNARTWNLLIDIIAQSGRYPSTLGPGASFDNFLPDGEKRYWLHVAIDRYTGKVVDRFLEPVRE